MKNIIHLLVYNAIDEDDDVRKAAKRIVYNIFSPFFYQSGAAAVTPSPPPPQPLPTSSAAAVSL